MKYADFKINENTIEFHNSLIGNETVFVDGKIVSEKFSIFGTVHKFELNKKEYQLISNTLNLGYGIKLELRANKKLINDKSINWTKQSSVRVAAILLLGWVLWRFYWW